MSGLMRANLMRLFKSKAFRVCLIVSPAIKLLSLLFGILGNIPFHRAQVPLEPSLFQSTPNLVPLLAVPAALFFGREYSDGGLRSKLIVGHSRAAVWFSDLLTCFTAGLLIFAVQFSLDLALGLARGYHLFTSSEEIGSRVLICIGAILALSAIFTLLGTIISSRPGGVAAAIFLALTMLIGSSVILDELAEPEYLSTTTVTYLDETDENGEPREEIIQEENPNYVGGALRQTLETLNDLLPTGQLLRMGMAELVITENGEPTERDVGSFAERAAPMTGYSLGLVFLAAVGGMRVFRKKDIR